MKYTKEWYEQKIEEKKMEIRHLTFQLQELEKILKKGDYKK